MFIGLADVLKVFITTGRILFHIGDLSFVDRIDSTTHKRTDKI